MAVHLQQLGAAGVAHRAADAEALTSRRRTRRSPPPTTPTSGPPRGPSRAGSRSPTPTTASSELTGQSGAGRRRGHPDQDVRLRHRREPDVRVHVEHRVQRVERDQRGLHLQRPRPGADRVGVGRVHVLRVQRGRAGRLGRRRGRHHRPTPTTARAGWRRWPARRPGPPRPTPTTPTPRSADLLRDGQRQTVVRLRCPAAADLRHAEDLLRSTVASVGYGYDADSQVTSETTPGLAGPARSTYTYDEAGRLTSWNNGTATTAYGYDGNGNLTTDGSKTYAYDARDELTGDGTNSYTYTARGTASSESSPSGTVAVSFDAYGDQATAGTPVLHLRRPRPADRRHAHRRRQRVPVLLRGPDRARSRPTGRRPTRGTRRAARWPRPGHRAGERAGSSR